ncbi:MAG: hypothetical protein AAFR66_11260 [Bacteroidota bacterium]
MKDGINYLNNGNAVSQEMLTVFENHFIPTTESASEENRALTTHTG